MTDTALLDASTVGTSAALVIRQERAGDARAVDALVEAAFGPGRYAKTAERVRECARERADLCYCALSGEELAGAVRLWSVAVGGRPALFLGPIAVAAHLRGRGIAAMLVQAACAAAQAAGERVVILVGDGARFGPMGFEPVPPGRVSLPGPVDPHRLLWRTLGGAAPHDVAGAVTGPAG